MQKTHFIEPLTDKPLLVDTVMGHFTSTVLSRLQCSVGSNSRLTPSQPVHLKSIFNAEDGAGSISGLALTPL